MGRPRAGAIGPVLAGWYAGLHGRSRAQILPGLGAAVVARIRTIKQEFWTDEAIAECSMSARLLFIATWNFADDQGGLDRSAKQLKAQAFPYDVIDCEPLVQELLRHGLLIEDEANGRKYLHINGFRKHQRIDRPTNPRFPVYEPSRIPREDSTSTPRALALEGKGREGKGVEGKGIQSAREQQQPEDVPRGTPRPVFDGVQFFIRALARAYPRHDLTDTDVMQAGRALEVLISEGHASELDLAARLAEFRAQQDAAGNTDTKYVMKPAKFFEVLGHWRGPFPIVASKATSTSAADKVKWRPDPAEELAAQKLIRESRRGG
jgi:hypothetical protein